MKRVDGAVKSITAFSDGARQTLAEVDKILAGVDPGAVRETIANIEEASKNANKVVEDVSKVTSKVGQRADDIDKIVSDATELADRLNHASVRVDGILAKVNSLLGSDETKGLVKEASDTLKILQAGRRHAEFAARRDHRRARALLQSGPEQRRRAGARRPPLDQPHRGGRHRPVAQPAADHFRRRRNSPRI